MNIRNVEMAAWQTIRAGWRSLSFFFQAVKLRLKLN